jgi:cell division septal protein FtsQ
MQKKVAKKQFKSKAKQKKIIFLLAFVLLALSILAGLSVTVWFPVKSVQISGSEIYNDIELVSALDINEKENLLLLNQESLLAKLQENFPYIKSLTLKSPLLSAIKINEIKNNICFVKTIPNI